MTKPPVGWCAALEAEYLALHGEPALQAGAPADPDARLREVHDRIHQRGTSALCLSGGGIRSATFALGVLQGLAYAGVLGSIDYLSTVSGGGYTGGWFTAWLKREGPDGRAAVLDTIDPGRRLTSDGPSGTPDPSSPIERVRDTCRYLAPRGGVVSADVWTLLTTLARNLILNWLVVLPLIAAALMLPRLYYAGVSAIERPVAVGACQVSPAAGWSFAIAMLSAAMATGYLILNFVGVGARWSQGRFLTLLLLPTMIGTLAVTCFWAAYPCRLSLVPTLLVSAGLPAAGWIVIGAVASLVARRRRPDGGTLRVRVGLRTIAAALIAGPVVGLGTWWMSGLDYGFGVTEQLRQLYAVTAVPIVLVFGTGADAPLHRPGEQRAE